MSIVEQPSVPDLPSSMLPVFILLTFAITWSSIGFYIVFPDQAASLFGDISGSHPVFFLATWGPAIAAVLLILTYGGAAGLRAFFSRLFLWRAPLPWVIFVTIGLPFVFVAGSLIKGGPVLAPMPPDGTGPVFALLFMMLFLGPIEELGWRGVAQPLLQRHMAPIWAGTIIGSVWGIWHLPAFFLAGISRRSSSGMSYWPFW